MTCLNEVLNFLMKLLKTTHINSFFSQRLYSNHLLELILSHLQLLHSPNLKYSSQEFSSINLQENLLYLQKSFSNLFIQQILLLNRLLSTTINSPMWLKNRCGDLLTSILINPNNQGIRQLFQTILDSTSPNDRLYTSMSQILSTCPKQLKPEEYFQCIKSQLIELIHDKRYMPIICISINQLFKKYRKLVEEEIFTILFQPLISCRNEVSTEEQFELFVDDLYNLIITTPNEQIRIYLYENYLNELLNIYLALENSLSSLKMKYFSILLTLFSSMDTEIFVQYFEKILFHFEDFSLKFSPDVSSKVCLIKDEHSENNIERFCQLLTKILFSMENNQRLIVKIFLHLLQLLITPSNQLFIRTEKEKQNDIKQFKILQVLKFIMEYLTEHIQIIIENIDDTIKVIQVEYNQYEKFY
jgi:hypothetical protein